MSDATSATQQQKEIAVVVYGATQAGKSSAVAWLTLGGEKIETGDGDGDSVTSVATLYQRTRLGKPLVDTPGLNDSMLRFTNVEAGKRVALAVAEAHAQALQFIVLDSLANDSIQLGNTLSEFALAFGEAVLPSVVVMASKADKCPAKSKEKRIDRLREIAQKKGITQVVVWQNEGISEEGKLEQLGRLLEALAAVPPVSTEDLQELNDRIAKKAQELHNLEPPKTKTIQVDEEYAEPFQSEEEYDEPYTYDTTEKETYWEPTTVTKEVTERSVKVEKGNAWVKVISFGIAGHDKQYETTTTKQVEAQELEKKTRTKTVQKIGTKKATRSVTKFRTQTRQVDKSVEYKPSVEHYYDKALAVITAEMRADFAAA